MRLLVTIASLLCLLNAPAWADTDYRCLKSCVREGKTSNVCMKECAYGEEAKPKAEHDLTDPAGTAHNSFEAPKPIANGAILPSKRDTSKPESMDYTCIATCQKSGMQYQLCRKKCVKEESGQKLPAARPK